MSQVGTAWCWPPDDHVCPLRPGWLMAFLSLRRVLCGLLEQEGVGCCAELPQGTACLPPYFPGSKSAPQVWETVGLPSQPAVAAGCETASLHHGPGFSATGCPRLMQCHCFVPLFFLCLPFGARLLSWHRCRLFLVYLCKGPTVLNSSTDLFAPWLDLAAVSCSGLCCLPCHFPGLRSLPHPCCPWYLSQLPV